MLDVTSALAGALSMSRGGRGTIDSGPVTHARRSPLGLMAGRSGSASAVWLAALAAAALAAAGCRSELLGQKPRELITSEADGSALAAAAAAVWMGAGAAAGAAGAAG